jgi:hypothetical protein
MIRSGKKIGFTGAGGTGKTTSAIEVAKALSLPLLQSASRMVYEKNGLTEDKVRLMSSEEKWELQSDIFDEKIKADDQGYSFVADRTLLDHYAYCLMYCGDSMRNSDFYEYENKVRKHMKSTYHKIFYFPVGYFKPEEDGVRSNVVAWQSAIDAVIVGYILRWNVPIIEVPQTKGVSGRNKFILDRINPKREETEEEVTR